jgi:hypothetical protein
MDGWYYSRNGQSVGPIPLAQLKQLAAAGDVAPEDQVWHPSLAGWTVARRVPGLVPVRAGRSAFSVANAPPPQTVPQPLSANATPASPPADQQAAATPSPSSPTGSEPDFQPVMVQPGAGSAAQASPETAAPGEVPFRTIQILHHSRLWLAILALAMFTLAVATLLTAIALFSGSANFAQLLRQQSGYVAAPLTFQIAICAAAYVVIAGLSAVLGLCLVRALMRIGTLTLNRSPDDLEDALAAQLLCWRLAALLVIASVGLAVVLALVV